MGSPSTVNEYQVTSFFGSHALVFVSMGFLTRACLRRRRHGTRSGRAYGKPTTPLAPRRKLWRAIELPTSVPLARRLTLDSTSVYRGLRKPRFSRGLCPFSQTLQTMLESPPLIWLDVGTVKALKTLNPEAQLHNTLLIFLAKSAQTCVE